MIKKLLLLLKGYRFDNGYAYKVVEWNDVPSCFGCKYKGVPRYSLPCSKCNALINKEEFPKSYYKGE